MKSNSAKGYDQLAPWYEIIERIRFGSTLQRARIACLEDLPVIQNALFLGDGDGRLLAAFVKRQEIARITSVDISPRMLAMQKNRLSAIGANNSICWLNQSADSLDFIEQGFDLIVTPFMLDCFDRETLETLLPKFASFLQEGGLWYFVDFRVPEMGVKRYWARLWLAIMHLFFHWQTNLQTREIVNVLPFLDNLGFQAVADKRFHFDMIHCVLFRRTAAKTTDSKRETS